MALISLSAPASTESTGVGTLNSLNSFKYNLPLLGNKMYGRYFGSVIQAAYNNAQGL